MFNKTYEKIEEVLTESEKLRYFKGRDENKFLNKIEKFHERNVLNGKEKEERFVATVIRLIQYNQDFTKENYLDDPDLYL